MTYRESDEAQKPYRRYVTRGPYVSWAQTFGQECPAPDFAGAARRLRAEQIARFRHLLRRSIPWLAALSIGAGLVALNVWRSRRRTAPVSAQPQD